MPAQMAVVDTATFEYKLVTLSAPGQKTTIAGHQWTSPSGRYTFASFEGGTSPGVAVIDHFEEDTSRATARVRRTSARQWISRIREPSTFNF